MINPPPQKKKKRSGGSFGCTIKFSGSWNFQNADVWTVNEVEGKSAGKDGGRERETVREGER